MGTLRSTESVEDSERAWDRTVVALVAASLTAAGVEEAQFEAQLLTGLALERTRAQVVARSFGTPSRAQWQRLERLVRARLARVPFAYLRGTQWFHGIEFDVTPDVLIPRPETELLVEFALERIAERGGTTPTIADVGTGSGCVAIAVLVNSPNACAIATDVSLGALEVAGENAARYNVNVRMRLVRASLLDSIRDGAVDLIVSNPPYVASGEVFGLQPEVRDHEPRIALDGGADGLAAYRALANAAPRSLRPGGWIAVEVGSGQAEDVARMFASIGLNGVGTRRDFAGIERIVFGRRD